ncbi:MAG: tetratricopeptide repeat protein [Bacteroidota bacterium]
MKNVLLICILAGAVSAVVAQTPEQTFLEANQLYQQGKLQEAREQYERLRSAGLESAELYYNLGNTFYKLGNVARAILNYERALKLAPDDEDILFNLQLANLMLTDKIEVAPKLFIWEYWEAVKSAFSLTVVTWLAYLFFALALGSLSAFILARTYAARKFSFVGAIASGVVCLLFVIIFTAKLSDMQRSDTAIVLVEVVNVKNSPDGSSSDAFVLHGGTKVQITDQVGNWLKIRLADGKVGWMEQGSAETI